MQAPSARYRRFLGTYLAPQRTRMAILAMLMLIDLALQLGLPRVVQFLLRAGADPDLRDALNRTPREIAVMRGFIDIAAEFAPATPGQNLSMARLLRDPR